MWLLWPTICWCWVCHLLLCKTSSNCCQTNKCCAPFPVKSLYRLTPQRPQLWLSTKTILPFFSPPSVLLVAFGRYCRCTRARSRGSVIQQNTCIFDSLNIPERCLNCDLPSLLQLRLCSSALNLRQKCERWKERTGIRGKAGAEKKTRLADGAETFREDEGIKSESDGVSVLERGMIEDRAAGSRW